MGTAGKSTGDMNSQVCKKLLLICLALLLSGCSGPFPSSRIAELEKELLDPYLSFNKVRNYYQITAPKRAIQVTPPVAVFTAGLGKGEATLHKSHHEIKDEWRADDPSQMKTAIFIYPGRGGQAAVAFDVETKAYRGTSGSIVNFPLAVKNDTGWAWSLDKKTLKAVEEQYAPLARDVVLTKGLKSPVLAIRCAKVGKVNPTSGNSVYNLEGDFQATKVEDAATVCLVTVERKQSVGGYTDGSTATLEHASIYVFDVATQECLGKLTCRGKMPARKAANKAAVGFAPIKSTLKSHL